MFEIGNRQTQVRAQDCRFDLCRQPADVAAALHVLNREAAQPFFSEVCTAFQHRRGSTREPASQVTLSGKPYANVHITTGDGRLGWPSSAPFDRVVAWCSVDAVPQPWLDQSRPNAILLVPMRSPEEHWISVCHRSADGRVVHQERFARGFIRPTATPLRPWMLDACPGHQSVERRSLTGMDLPFAHRRATLPRTAAALPDRVLSLPWVQPFLSTGRLSALSVRSQLSFLSIGSVLSAASILSIASVGSILSVGSSASLLSIGSAGSILSIGSAGSIGSIGGAGLVFGRRRERPAP